MSKRGDLVEVEVEVEWPGLVYFEAQVTSREKEGKGEERAVWTSSASCSLSLDQPVAECPCPVTVLASLLLATTSTLPMPGSSRFARPLQPLGLIIQSQFTFEDVIRAIVGLRLLMRPHSEGYIYSRLRRIGDLLLPAFWNIKFK